MRDDGAVVYINGTEVARPNMPAGTITNSTQPSSIAYGASEFTFFGFAVSPGVLQTGTNVIAVQVHNHSVNSSDISFDLRLIAG